MANILVIDDDENNRLLLGTLLEHAGHSVLEAATGDSGAQLAVQERPEVIVIDLALPDMSGAALIRRLRSDPRSANAILALYTATELTPALRDLIDDFGIRGVIPKPGDPTRILSAFAALVEGIE